MFNSSSNKIEKEFENLRNELLDLTLRNQLLNFKLRAKTIAIENQRPINLFQNLVLLNKKMYFEANKKDEKKNKAGGSFWDDLSLGISKFGEGDKTLKTNLTQTELQKRLFYINNQAKTMLQEQGYNILYLAVGFLEWTDNKKPKQKNMAPLILIPVSIERKKVGKSFELSWTGEDIQTNISLKAKLAEDGIELPDFEFKRYAEVVDHYISQVKDITSHMRGWEVNSDIALGFFSFTKFVMYNDLNPESWDENVDLTKNELIQAIFNPEVNNQEAFDEEDIDSQLDYGTMYQVLDADSSQIAVIEDVKAGRNLVVEGPPGTGKSQTIVNLIAELLAEGKTVLFVSEKMAALEVVKERLQSVGLGKFVLELHSHKTRRKKFLKDLEKAATVRPEKPLNIEPTIRKLETLKKELDAYPEAIHQKYYGVNLSPFELYGMKEDAEVHFVKKDKMLPLVKFDQPELITLKDLDDMVFALENVAELFQTISAENPWSKCAPDSLLPADLREIEILITDTLQALDEFMMERQWINENFGIKASESLSDFTQSMNAFKIIDAPEFSLIDSTMLTSNVWNVDSKEPAVLIENLEKYQQMAGILNNFTEAIFHADIDLLIADVQKLANKKFRLFKNKQNQEVVERYYKTPVPDTNQILRDLSTVKSVLDTKKYLDSNEAIAQQYFGLNWSLTANINNLKAVEKWMREFSMLVNNGVFSNKTIDLLSKDLFNVNIKENISNYTQVGERFEDKLSKLVNKLKPQSRLIFNRDTENVSLNQWKNQLTLWRGQLSSLHLWSQYLNTKQSLKGTYSEPFVDIIERRNIKKEDVKSLVYGNFADALLNIMFLNNQELATFIGELHENKIKEFKELDKKILELNRQRIFHKLNSNIPDIFGGAQGSEAQILAGEFTRKSGHLPVRKLLQKAGGLIKQIKPVFMMSPLSIAQYLDPTNEKLQFDVVIFDEASQVKPQDALGAFMRAKTAVVMGDTQQLPPTSFFEQMADGDSYEEEATSLDMESILHLCKLSFPVKMLKWHYRSRHESLIAVSNTQFYDDELLVYPSPSHNDPELGLKLHYNPNTHYDRGSSSANVGEAKDVVDAIFEHFDNYGDTKSLGVGTFSVAQKNAILEELELRRKQRPELEPLFDDNKEERFFVKNLETIQGDERDVILISVGYGYDNEGKMSLNFGPLNQDGGERRLNVLITRAREKCVVFSNFKAADMHLTENPPFGVKSLKEFLFYADNLTSGNKFHEDYKDQKFEDSIARFLEESGYTVDRQIGCAGFRVDLAIVDEENPGQYYLGITTDGEIYSSSKVARDRNRLREQVLEGLGWNIYHLWSTDWYRNRDLGRNKLLQAIEDAKVKQREIERVKQEEAEKRKIEIEKLKLALEEEEEENSEEEPIITIEDDCGQNDQETIMENADGTIIVENKSDNVQNSSSNQTQEPVIEIIDDDNENETVIDYGQVYDDLEPVNNVEDFKDEFLKEVSDETAFDNFEESEQEVDYGRGSGSGAEDVATGYGRVEDDVIVDDSVDYGRVDSNAEDVVVDYGRGGDSGVEDVATGYGRVEDDVIVDDSVDYGRVDSNVEDVAIDYGLEDDFQEEIIVDYGHDEFENPFNQQTNEPKQKPSKLRFKGSLSQDFEDEGFGFDNNDFAAKSNSQQNFKDLNSPNRRPRKKTAKRPENPNYNDTFDGFENETFVEVNKENVNEGEQSYSDIGETAKKVNYVDVERNVPDREKPKKERKGIFNSIIDSFKGDTKLNVTGAKTYDDELREVYIPEVEVNENPVRPHIKKKNVIDVVPNDPNSNGNVYDKDDDVKEMANKIVDDVFDSMLGGVNPKSSPKENNSSQDTPDNKRTFNAFDETKQETPNINKTQSRPVNTDKDISTEKKTPVQKQVSKEEKTVIRETPSKQESAKIREDQVNEEEQYGSEEYYETSKDIRSPLRKNNISQKGSNGNGILQSLSNLKDEVTFLNKAMNEIENPSQHDYVNTIDRTNVREKAFLDDEKDLRDEYFVDEKPAKIEHQEEKLANSKNEINYNEVLYEEQYNKENNLGEIIQNQLEEEDELDEIAQNEMATDNGDDLAEMIQHEIEQDDGIIRINKEKRPSRSRFRVTDYQTTEGLNITSDVLYNSSSEEVSKIVNKIVEVEGPIHTNELIKRIRENSDIKRIGAKLKQAVSDAVEVSEKSGNIIKANDFLFNSSNQNINIRKRVKPNIELISDEEIEMNIKYILTDNRTFDSSKIAKEAASNFGFKSVSKKTAGKINDVLDAMIVNGKVTLDGKTVRLN